jgi:hypothetical protein
VSPRPFEDGTTGRPLGDDEDLVPELVVDEPEREDRWNEMSQLERAREALRAQR